MPLCLDGGEKKETCNQKSLRHYIAYFDQLNIMTSSIIQYSTETSSKIKHVFVIGYFARKLKAILEISFLISVDLYVYHPCKTKSTPEKFIKRHKFSRRLHMCTWRAWRWRCTVNYTFSVAERLVTTNRSTSQSNQTRVLILPFEMWENHWRWMAHRLNNSRVLVFDYIK